ncbi:hypothetical protein [Saccharolobus islandicus]|jgi:hypothetical protein|uniref:Carboxypeptidase regulatory-like domain-containing protein n=5 Tax=Saccharolobus islandicus TaxID=43080 RepID=C3MQD6_SACI2|nr:hypothetical protein [Sulfolobus islandicus]ACP35599.1 conserved hypothetical protein [Sulfolobus islandicus L.S.2.15]ACP38237.1 conserved hypothetical protein [Sulfolobus islandicus M.14.25]ACP48440.1 conserved hypothetical protein [Sulfolobus islandicus Y.N.15.51]ACR42085.1 conserved hypothetical protein [Sulfolobus islandicus M.16.4]ADB87355.1 conserved hypothetical protein [Sulfolobus islandicus L.D.8.5]
MNRQILLALAVLVIIVMAIGVYEGHKYRTEINTIVIGGQQTDGTYTLKVNVIMNYGLFGGESPLPNAVIWIYKYNGTTYSFYTYNFTNSQGIASFSLPAGQYKILVTQLHLTYIVTLNQNEEVIIKYAYLNSG